MNTWEYKTFINVNAADLNKLGNEGWELVTVVQTSSYKMFYFKREKQQKVIISKNIE